MDDVLILHSRDGGTNRVKLLLAKRWKKHAETRKKWQEIVDVCRQFQMFEMVDELKLKGRNDRKLRKTENKLV